MTHSSNGWSGLYAPSGTGRNSMALRQPDLGGLGAPDSTADQHLKHHLHHHGHRFSGLGFEAF